MINNPTGIGHCNKHDLHIQLYLHWLGYFHFILFPIFVQEVRGKLSCTVSHALNHSSKYLDKSEQYSYFSNRQSMVGMDYIVDIDNIFFTWKLEVSPVLDHLQFIPTFKTLKPFKTESLMQKNFYVRVEEFYLHLSKLEAAFHT